MLRLACLILILLSASESSFGQVFGRLRPKQVVVQQAPQLFQQSSCSNGVCVPQQIVTQRVEQVPFVEHQQVVVQNAQPFVNHVVGIPVPVQYVEPIAQQGTTIYGYQSLNQLRQPVDLSLLYNQAARLTDQAQQLAGQASTDFHALVQAEGQMQADVARIIAQGQAAQAALSAVNSSPSPVAERKAFSFKVTSESDGTIKVEGLDEGGPDFGLLSQKSSNSLSVLQDKCLKCHSDKNPLGGLNLSRELSQEQIDSILERVTTSDQSMLMPRTADGKPGKRLTKSEINLLYRSLISK